VEEGNTNFVLAGDSAGGHFAITYTEFIRLKKPYLPYPIKLVLISPWVNLAVDERDYKPGLSYYELRHRDYIGYGPFKKPKNGLMFIDDEHRVDHSFLDWSYRCRVDWKRNPFFTNPDNEVFVVYGEHESFRDDIDTWLRQIYELPKIPYETSNGKQIPEFSFTSQEAGKPKLTAYVEPWGVHDSFFLLEGDLLDRYKDFDQLPDESYFSSKRLVKFLRDTL
jgi:acetyl esterase/lipase